MSAPPASPPARFHCPVCNRLVLVGRFVGWVEGFCGRCKKRRRFEVTEKAA